MLSQEEFMQLYKKFQKGSCTPEEIELLYAHQEEAFFSDLEWEDAARNKKQVHDRIWQRLNESRTVQPGRQRTSFVWLRVAAAALIVVSVGLLLGRHLSQTTGEEQQKIVTKKVTIIPGGNKATLTMSDGKTIVLTDVENGHLATHSGIEVRKTQDGMLVYDFKAPQSGMTDAPASLLNTVSTPKGGQYQIKLSDGTSVWLNAASSLRFPVSFTGAQREVELNGEAYFEVAKNRNQPFIVSANGTSVQVLGTHFNVSAYHDDYAVTTTLLEGSVRLYKGSSSVLLRPGQQGKSMNNQMNISVQPVNLEQVIAWKDGYFMFKNESITTIMKQAARWYDIDVVYQDQLKDQEFGGKISRYSDISELLKNLELTGTIHFKVEGRRVTVMR